MGSIPDWSFNRSKRAQRIPAGGKSPIDDLVSGVATATDLTC
jgi:hypothetical protein